MASLLSQFTSGALQDGRTTLCCDFCPKTNSDDSPSSYVIRYRYRHLSSNADSADASPPTTIDVVTECNDCAGRIFRTRDDGPVPLCSRCDEHDAVTGVICFDCSTPQLFCSGHGEEHEQHHHEADPVFHRTMQIGGHLLGDPSNIDMTKFLFPSHRPLGGLASEGRTRRRSS